jgi:hypothetical protein
MRQLGLFSAAIWTAMSITTIVSADEKASAKAESSSSAQSTITVTVDSDGQVKINGRPENKSAKAASSKAESSSSSGPAGKEKSNGGVETFSFGKVIVLGPDGKTEVQEFKELDEALPKEILEKLPAQVRKELEKNAAGKAEATKGKAGKGAKAAAEASAQVMGKMKVITIGPDGKVQESETEFGGKPGDNPLGVQLDIADLLKKAGVALPAEAQQALEAAGKPAPANAEKANDVDTKLDKILQRLERIEKELSKLKTPQAQ